MNCLRPLFSAFSSTLDRASTSSTSNDAENNQRHSHHAKSSSSSSAKPASVSPPDAATQKLFEMMSPLVVSTSTLDFGPRSTSEVQRTITLTNHNSETYPPIAWKVLTNLQYQYCVRPNMGVLKSGESLVVTIIRESPTRQGSDSRPAESSPSKRRPAFLIRNTPILENWYPVEGRPGVLSLWKELGKQSASLTFTEHKVTANKPDEPSSKSSSSPPSTPNAATDSAAADAEIARLRAENALLRAQVTSMSTASLLVSGSGPTTPDGNDAAGPSEGGSRSRRHGGVIRMVPAPPLSTTIEDNLDLEGRSRRRAGIIGMVPVPPSLATIEDEWYFEDAAPTYEEAVGGAGAGAGGNADDALTSYTAATARSRNLL